MLPLEERAQNVTYLSDIGMGKNLVERDILVVPMDVTAVDQLEFHFQQVIEHFGKVKIYFICLFF
jgi:hypothetical protein